MCPQISIGKRENKALHTSIITLFMDILSHNCSCMIDYLSTQTLANTFALSWEVGHSSHPLEMSVKVVILFECSLLGQRVDDISCTCCIVMCLLSSVHVSNSTGSLEPV